MTDIAIEMEKKLEALLGGKQNGKYILTDGITVVVEEQKESPYLWFEDKRGVHAFTWLFNIEKTDNVYNFFSDKYEYIVRNTLEEVFDVVKARKY